MMENDWLMLMLKVHLAASATILALILLRGPVRAAFGSRTVYTLWAAIPFAILGALWPARVVVIAVTRGGPPAGAHGTTIGLTALAPDTLVATAHGSPHMGIIMVLLWAGGCIACALYFATQQIRFQKRLGRLTPDPDGGSFWYAETTDICPLLLGVLRPRIVVPADFRTRFTPSEQALALAHEEAHRQAGDTRVLACLAAVRCLGWVNPLIHWAADVVRLDQEMARDAAVTAHQARSKREYGAMLLNSQLRGAAPIACGMPSTRARALRVRLLALRISSPGRVRQVGGRILALVLCASASAAAWGAQPPRKVAVAHETGAAIGSTTVTIAQRDGAAAPRMVVSGNSSILVQGGRVSLVQAVRHGNIGVVRQLLDSGADPNLVVPGDGTALINAVRQGEHAMVRLLLERGARPGLSAPGDGSPLIAAAAVGDQSLIEEFSVRGAKVNEVVPGDETALINAARFGHLNAVRMLVARGADVNLKVLANPNRNPEWRSPLGEAMKAGYPDVTAYLREQGARP